MQHALRLAQQAAEQGEVPVGCVIVRNDEVVASAHNLSEAQHNPTAHAEMLAIQHACVALSQQRLKDCDLYVTLEPCAMCAAAISFARIRRLYFGAYDPKTGGVEQGGRFYAQPTCHHAPEVIGGVMEAECGAMLKEFFAQRR